MTQLVWLRRDLRLTDNPALFNAAKNDDAIRCIYLDTPEQDEQHGIAPIQRDFIERNLKALAIELAAHQIKLEIIHSSTYQDAVEQIVSYVKKQNISKLLFNKAYAVNERARDQAVTEKLEALEVEVDAFDAETVVRPGRLTAHSGDMYKVFTPFSKAWLKLVREHGYSIYEQPAFNKAHQSLLSSNQSKDQSKDQPTDNIKLSGDKKSSEAWPAGEVAAKKRLTTFCQEQAENYGDDRNFPARAGTSQLSPYLAIGVISANQCLASLEATLGQLPTDKETNKAFTWLNEIIWRDFYRHLMLAYPWLSKAQAFKRELNNLPWPGERQHFKAWCEGETGFPIIDAAMRCLNETGWMHNRLRMIVASYLTKDLHIHWLEGERYFMQQLIDGDFASNNGGWQWAASTGADAAPYFRIFNPTTQSERFDKQGQFIKKWCPELKDVPAKHIHNPHHYLQEHDQKNAYPKPIIEHKAEREKTLSLFKDHKG